MSFESYIQQIRDIGKKVKKREFPEFDNLANLSQLNYLEARESANERAAKADMAQAAQEYDRGLSLGGQKAGDEIHRRDIRQGQLQADQSAARAMTEKLKFEQDRNDRANAYLLQAAQAGMQYETLQQKEQLQMKLAQLQASQRQLDRETQEGLAKARNALQADSIRKQHAIATSQLKQRAREAAEQIATSQQRRGVGGGGGMTASYSSGAGNFKDHLRSMGVMA